MRFVVNFDETDKRLSSGFRNTEQRIQTAFKGIQTVANNGKSAYEIALEQGFEGTEAEWIESLRGDDYILTEADKQEIAEQAAELVDVPEGGGGGGVTAEEVDEKIAEAIEAIPNPSWNNLTDRPFYDETKSTLHFAFNGTSAATGADGWLKVSKSMVLNFALTDGKQYRVSVYSNDTTLEYTGVGRVTGGTYSKSTIGNEGDPIYVIHNKMVYSVDVAFQTDSTATNWDVEIYEVDGNIVTLDEKYIPDTVARTADIPSVPTVEEIVEDVLEQISEQPSGVFSWNDLTDRPFGETERTTFDFVENASAATKTVGGIIYQWVADNPYATTNIKLDGLLVGSTIRYDKGVMYGGIVDKVVTSADIESGGDSIYGYYLVIDKKALVLHQRGAMGGVVGIYLAKSDAGSNGSSKKVLSFTLADGSVVPLDEKYIPDTIARVADIPTEADIQALIDASLGVIENGTY